MDSKFVGRGIAIIVSAVILIVLLVYALNTDLMRQRSSGNASVATSYYIEAGPTVYGVRIGEDLKSFLKDENFFDVKIEQGAVEVSEDDSSQSKELRMYVQADDKEIVITIVDKESYTVSGELFKVNVENTLDLKHVKLQFIDDDKDGQIIAKDLADGIYSVSMEPIRGYRIPTEPAEITLGNPDDIILENSGETEDGEDPEAENPDDGELPAAIQN